MAIDLTGITNNNEFYTQHYLSAILENDLKDLFQKWKTKEQEEGVRPPYAQLKGLSRDYSIMRNRLEREKRPEKRLRLQREFLEKLLPALGYSIDPILEELDDGSCIPLLGAVNRSNGAPELWIIEALDLSGEDVDPLELTLCECQFPDGEHIDKTILNASLEEIVTRQVFSRSEPPHWVVLVSDAQIILIDRGKWNEKRSLRFQLPEIFGRREASTLRAMAALLHRESICPDDGLSLLDTLDENSHK
ncbi:MAG: hypothetical protein DRG87_10330, partial [Deltaproteobacteria bacterium]